MNHKHVDELKSSLSFVKEINNKQAIIKTIGVSGILKKAENNYLK